MPIFNVVDGKEHPTPLGFSIAKHWQMLGHGLPDGVRVALIGEIYFAVNHELTAEEHELRAQLIPGYDRSIVPEYREAGAWQGTVS